MVDNQPAEVPDLSGFNAQPMQFQLGCEAQTQLAPENDLELPTNGHPTPQNQNPEDADLRLWELLEVALLSDPTRSQDWLAKNIIMPRLAIGRPKAIALVCSLQQKYGN
jgi:hypothetical protein